MANDISSASPPATADTPVAGKRRLPPELSILGVMIGMMLLFEVLGWIFVGQSFIANPLRLKIMILQESEIGIIAVGVTQTIIMAGIDLSSGSVVGMTAMIAASLAQVSGYQPRRLSEPHRPQPDHPGGGGTPLRPRSSASSTAG